MLMQYQFKFLKHFCPYAISDKGRQDQYLSKTTMKLIQKSVGDGFTRVSSMQGLGAEEHYQWKNENSELVYEQTHIFHQNTYCTEPDRNRIDKFSKSSNCPNLLNKYSGLP
jgi:hypothetical protein